MVENDELVVRFNAANDQLPLVAILRGIKTEEAEDLGSGLYEEGFRIIEVPLNSPDPFGSISAIRRKLPKDAMVGAGTVLEVEKVDRLKEAGGEMVFMPHSDLRVVRAAKELGLLCIPGVATATEAFAALDAGADALKLFPGEMITPAVLKALKVVLPKNVRLLPFGGITPDTMKPYYEAGARAFGLGSALYKPGMSRQELMSRARMFVTAWRQLTAY